MEEPADETANSFVPEMLVNFVNKNLQKGKEGLEPASFFIHGVCLLVDISGFTKLSGDFCSQGKAGIDELQRATNGYMGKLVEIIYTFGGEIIKFAGDAIICVFSSNYITALSVKKKGGRLRRSVYTFEAIEGFGDNSPGAGKFIKAHKVMVKEKSHLHLISPEVVLRAMHCARMLRVVQTEKLSVHVAMSCGEMCFGILGGFENRWECLISGPCIHQLSDCLDDAPSKEAVISPECFSILQNSFSRVSLENLPIPTEESFGIPDPIHRSSIEAETGKYEYTVQALPSGNYRIIEVECEVNATQVTAAKTKALANSAVDSHLAQMIHQFVPLPIAEELESAAGLTNYLAEIREVTTMFMKWESYDADGKHRNLMELQQCFYEAQRILQTTGAYLRQFLVDDKGCVLIGCWGMPHLSYLDNAYRALSAAAQIKYELNKLGMNCSFGITTGDVYCGTVGSPLRQEYAAIGSVVNMSARLMGKANGGILIDDATHARLPTNVLSSLNRLEPIKVKGRDEPLQVYSYTASGAMHVREKVVEDHEISAVCKNTLLSVVDMMVSKDSKFAEPHPPAAEPNLNITKVKDRSGSVVAASIASGLVDLLSTRGSSRGSSRGGSLTRSSAFATPTGTTMPLVLLQGKDGSGRTTVVRWLKKQASDRQLLVISAKASKKDSAVDYMIWRKIFQQLMPKDLFLSNETQRSYVRALLKEVFPDQQKVGQLMGFPALKNYLGITCSYTEGTSTEAEVKASKWSPHNRKDKKKPTSGKDKLMPIVDTMHKIFAHLLNLQTSLVIIENVEHADEASLELLVDLTTKLSSRSVICLTALLVDDKNGGRNKNIFQSGMRSVQVDAFHSTAWSKVYQGVILKNKSTISVTLENYTPEEIDKMLSVALGVREVPIEISQLVQDFSGGSYFWVREILQFIKEHGPESFMSAIGENEKEADAKTPVSPVRSTTIKPAPTKHTSMRQLQGAKSFVNATSMRNMSVNNTITTSIAIQAGAHRSQVKLDKLVLCRFENLHSHVQHVLRTASIIGMTFNSVVLYSIIPRHLKDQMSDCIKALLNQKWLYQDTDNESLYQFAHPHAHQIIYELTPSSERSNTHKAIAAHMEFTCGEDRAQFGAICFHYQHCDTDKALQYAVKAVAVMLESKNIFEYGDCLDLLFGCFSCCKNSFDVDVLMKLVNDTKNTIERLDLNQNKHIKRSFLDALFSCSHDTSAVTPEETIQHKQSFSSEKMSDGSGRSEISDLSDKNYELRAKLVFLEQLDKLNDRLCESYVELVDSDDVMEAKEWQRHVLGLSAKNTNVLSRFVRSLSEVYEVDEHMQRKNPRN